MRVNGNKVFRVFSWLIVVGMMLTLVSCGKGAEQVSTDQEVSVESVESDDENGNMTMSAAKVNLPEGPAVWAPIYVPFHSFDGMTVPKNGANKDYPEQYTGAPGTGSGRIISQGCVRGNCLDLTLTSGVWYPHFSAKFPNGTLGFAREFAQDPARWDLGKGYTAMSFWIKLGANAPLIRDPNANFYVGDYRKNMFPDPPGPDKYTDEKNYTDLAGRQINSHGYYHFNIPPDALCKAQVDFQYPNYVRNQPEQNFFIPESPFPSDAGRANIVDTLTRFYFTHKDSIRPTSYPLTAMLDEIEFFRPQLPQHPTEVYNMNVCYRKGATPYFMVGFSRNKNKPTSTCYEIRYTTTGAMKNALKSWENATQVWENAKPLPNATSVCPKDKGGYNKVVYEYNGSLPFNTATTSWVYLMVKPNDVLSTARPFMSTFAWPHHLARNL